MKKYLVQAGETFASLIQNYEIKSNEHLRLFHNLHCPEEDIVRGELIVGKEILIPDDPEYLIEETEEIDEGTDSMNETQSDTTNNSSTNNQKENEDENQAEDKNDDSEHEGKHFIIQKGMCQCNQGFKFPKFKVTSHQKHYWNDADGQADYLAVTEDDLTFDPPAMPFGNCKLRPTSGGYLPCVYAPAGKWTKTYQKVKVMDKSCLTEISELMCSTGGKITIMKHGQQSEIGKTNVNNANTQEQQVYNPVVDFDELKASLDQENQPEVY
ncbi:DUF4280 domain-containing protein [Empedobacter falsenii]|uniref:DUF4280 domain-containing protein n=1 Tax=Empedobacter falsenii TaxID=343874 RepID=UPI0025751FE3|nr:DUF4280 domain-containing protein [Empedobacter falsenii]MDM1299958.1 DUF4280 domain-containing protein [Empedobacter falsenii]MDM1319751.1 DUF4280 domain-containing protein [Empedobacter falsenii]